MPRVLLAFNLSSAAFALRSRSSCEFGLGAFDDVDWAERAVPVPVVDDSLWPLDLFGREVHEPILYVRVCSEGWNVWFGTGMDQVYE